MVAIEHRQKSAIIATDTTTTTTTIPTPTPTGISSSSSSEVATTLETLATTTSSRRSSDIVNSNDIAVLSPTSSTNSSSTITVITTTNAATSNIIYVEPINPKDKDAEEEEAEAEEAEDEVHYNTSPKLDKSPAKMSQSSSEASTATAESTAVVNKQAQTTKQQLQQQQQHIEPAVSKSAVSQRNVDIKIAKKSNKDITPQELSKKVLKLDLTGKDIDEYSIKSPRSPIASKWGTRLPHQSSLSTVDVEDRKTLREALYQGIFHRHRRTIFAVGSFLRMLRSRNSSYNTIRSSSEGEDVDETR